MVEFRPRSSARFVRVLPRGQPTVGDPHRPGPELGPHPRVLGRSARSRSCCPASTALDTPDLGRCLCQRRVGVGPLTTLEGQSQRVVDSRAAIFARQ